MSAERAGWPTHKAKAQRARHERRRKIRAERATRKLEQRKAADR